MEKEIKDNYYNQLTPSDKIELTEINYNCTECSSPIEIFSINENTNEIEFKCINETNQMNKIMPLKEYFKKMEKFKQNKINEDRCKIHLLYKENKYISFCLDCNMNLCSECLKSRTHLHHNKNLLIEVEPIKEELNIFEEIIKEFKIKLENLKILKLIKEEELEKICIKEKQNFLMNIEKNEKNKEIELNLNINEYLNDIQNIKNKYKKEIKSRLDKYNRIKKQIIYKYKLINEKDKIIYNYRIGKIYKKKSQNLDNKIENTNNIIRINE